jgi:hypothetical protein
MVEGGVAGGTTCAPIAGEILKGIFALEKPGAQIAMNYLPMVTGHFRGVSEVATGANLVNVPGEQPAAASESAEESVTPTAPAATSVQEEIIPSRGDEAPEPIRDDAEAPKIMPKRRF